MRLQLIPLGLVVEYVVGQIDDHLADEVVGAVAHIVPQCDLEKGDTLELHAWKVEEGERLDKPPADDR